MSELHYNDCGHACCLRVENLAVTIGGSQILKDMNLHIHCGEMVALIGPNGAGKSTFLKAILGQRRDCLFRARKAQPQAPHRLCSPEPCF